MRFYKKADLDKIVFSKKFESQRDAVLALLDNFQKSSGVSIGNGDRNVLKAFELPGITINVKSFKVPNLINKIVYRFFRMSKAQRSFEHATQLMSLGIGTPQPLAYVEFHQGPFLRQSYYVSEQLVPDFTFRELIHDPEIPKREEIIRKFTQFTFQLHENKILFKDHSPGNTLIKWEGSEVHFFLVDLNRMDFKALTFEERIKNFARLTPLKEMVALMSEEYAQLMGRSYEEVFSLMWKETEAFQHKFHRKRRLKKKLLFWRK